MFRALAGTVTSYRDGDFAFSLAWQAQRRARRAGRRAQRARRHAAQPARDARPPRAVARHDGAEHTGRDAARATRAATSCTATSPRESCSAPAADSRARELAALLEVAPGVAARGGRSAVAMACSSSSAMTKRRSSISRAAGFASTVARTSCSCCATLTVELHRQEVRTWKKVIRVISHELNNSLAPIASLAHSGGELVQAARSYEQLEKVFATIAERAKHLEQFISGYARFAKLPAPRLEVRARGASSSTACASQIEFEVDGPLPETPGRFDPAQLEQALVNLLRNAHESGSPTSRGRLARAQAAELPSRSRSATAAPGMNESRAVERAVAVLLDEARRHRPRARAGSRDRGSARRSRRARESARAAA